MKKNYRKNYLKNYKEHGFIEKFKNVTFKF